MSDDLRGRLVRMLQRLGYPVARVSVGDPSDRQTWDVELLASATLQQRIEALGVIRNYYNEGG
jgi:hypothetical protein